MQVNLPVWGYYPKDESTFIDPLYAPYMREHIYVPSKDGNDQLCEVNMFKQQGYPDGLVNPALVRKGWGLSFQLAHPAKDRCPHGWSQGEDGWCVANKPEFEGTFYTDEAHVAKYQYWGGYAPVDHKQLRSIKPTPFDRKSVSPWTGDYKVHYIPKGGEQRNKYGHLATKDSYLA